MKKEIIIDGNNAIMGRLASYAAKQVLRGENVIIVNAEKTVITGDRQNTIENFYAKRRRRGSTIQGPKHSFLAEKILKRAIRGMLPDHRSGRGKEALDRIRCYKGIPKEYQESKKILAGKEKIGKYIYLEEFAK
ncbi:MAG: 50S ribosomal protein L13 [Nanoarchaeota archaeon]